MWPTFATKLLGSLASFIVGLWNNYADTATLLQLYKSHSFPSRILFIDNCIWDIPLPYWWHWISRDLLFGFASKTDPAVEKNCSYTQSNISARAERWSHARLCHMYKLSITRTSWLFLSHHSSSCRVMIIHYNNGHFHSLQLRNIMARMSHNSRTPLFTGTSFGTHYHTVCTLSSPTFRITNFRYYLNQYQPFWHFLVSCSLFQLFV